MIRATWGFGNVDPAGVALQFDIASHYDDFGTAQLNPAPSGPGAGRALLMWDAAFGLPTLTRILDPQPFWCVGGNFGQFSASAFSFSPLKMPFLQLCDGASSIVGLQFEVDGRISIQDFVHNLEVARTGAVYNVPNAWPPYFELRASGFSGSSVSLELWINDVKQASGVAGVTGRIPDRITSQSVGNFAAAGLQFTNVYVLDGQGTAPWNDRLGPVRITTLIPSANGSGPWPATGAAQPYIAVQDKYLTDVNGSPDGDDSYVAPTALGVVETFQFGAVPCYGLILGLMLNYCFRGTTGSAGLEAILIIGSGVHNLGVLNVSGLYHTEQQFVGTNPATGQYFNDAEVAGNLWGALTNSSLDLRLTQMYIEKIVSLRNMAFGCGASNYSY